jgi:predicted RNA binding protein YcfA (HicA-like mRNA interferase family)
MKQISGKELAKALERHGWLLLRVKGSHHVYGKNRRHHQTFRARAWQHSAENRTAQTFAQARGII